MFFFCYVNISFIETLMFNTVSLLLRQFLSSFSESLTTSRLCHPLLEIGSIFDEKFSFSFSLSFTIFSFFFFQIFPFYSVPRSVIKNKIDYDS